MPKKKKRTKVPRVLKAVVQFELVEDGETGETGDGVTELCYRADNPKDAENGLIFRVSIPGHFESYEGLAGFLSRVVRGELISSAAEFLSTQAKPIT